MMKIPTDRKLTFVEFVAWQERDEEKSDVIDDSWLEHWKKHLPNLVNAKEHCGDCTNVPCPCELCVLKTLLEEYEEYFFGKEEVKKYQLLNDTLEPVNIFIDECAKEDFINMCGWSEEEFKQFSKEVMN